MAAFGAEGYVFVVEAEGGSYYLYRVKEDGTERRKAVEDPTLRSAIVGDPFDVSADGSWVSITVGLPAVDERRFIVKAYPLEGGEPLRICDNCWVHWDLGGKLLNLSFSLKFLGRMNPLTV